MDPPELRDCHGGLGRRWHDWTKAEMGGNYLIRCAYGREREEAKMASGCAEWRRSHIHVLITTDDQLLGRARNEGEKLEEAREAGLTAAWKMHEKSFCGPELYIHTDSCSPLSPDPMGGCDSQRPSAASFLGKPSPCL